MTRLGVALAAACAVSACSVPGPAPGPSADAVVYIIGRDWHTDIGLPVDEIAGPLTVLESRFPGVRVLTFGFGDRTFLLKRETSPWAMLGALLPGRGALLVTALNTTPEAAFGSQSVVRLRITPAELRNLRARLWREFEHSPEQGLEELTDGPYPGSLFFAASATYSGLYTCNTWTASIARAGGVAMPTTGVMFAGQVMGMARWLAFRENSVGRPGS